LVAVALVGVTGAQAHTESGAQTGSSKGVVTLRYLTFSAAPDHLDALNSIIRAFERRYPNIKVAYQTAPYDSYFTKLKTSIAGGDAPDTFELDYGNFVGYAASGSLLSLDTLARNDKTFSASRFYPRAYAAFRTRGHQYALPQSFSDVLLFYNKDLFQAAGVPLPTARWTWKDELAAAHKLTKTGSGVWGDFQPVTFFEFYKVLAQTGGSFFNAAHTRATFDSPKGVAAAQFLIGKVGTVMPDTEQMSGLDDPTMFKLGKLAMWHNGIWQFAAMADAKFHWDVVVEPGNTQKANAFFANAVAISAKSKHPKEAWLWLRFLASSATSVQDRVRTSWELPPVADQKLFSSYLTIRPPANRRAVFDALQNPVLPPTINAQTQMQDEVTNELQKAQAGQVSIAQALHDAAAQVNQLLRSGS
jgi:multiple sugar transport system substrate-binding protein